MLGIDQVVKPVGFIDEHVHLLVHASEVDVAVEEVEGGGKRPHHSLKQKRFSRGGIDFRLQPSNLILYVRRVDGVKMKVTRIWDGNAAPQWIGALLV